MSLRKIEDKPREGMKNYAIAPLPNEELRLNLKIAQV